MYSAMPKIVIFLFILGIRFFKEYSINGESTGYDSNDDSAYRLPRDTQPVEYGVRLVPKYDKGTNMYTFGGQVEILIKVNSITPDVVMNAKDMEIKSVAITELKTQTDLEVDGYQLVKDTEQLVINVAKNLLAGRHYQVKIVFQGYLRTDMTGFYRSLYNENGETKWMAVSQFKPTYARRAFPCYDEPMYKTPFNVSLGRQEYQMALSNMPRYMTQRLEYYGWWADHFKTTPPIPTYLVGILVGELKKSDKFDGSDINVYTYQDYLSQTDYVMNELSSFYQPMMNYTESSNELEKMDFLAIPDFNTDGMENWGINAYREKYMLFDDNSKRKFIELSTMVIQQQQSHQWFGNMVTCSWWDFLWLNEGFSQYFRYFATEIIKSDWRLEELFVIEQHQVALNFDQTPQHAMTVEVKSSEDIQNVFDSITYSKTAAILRMIRYVITDFYFREPLILYLENYKYGIVSPDVLWSTYENYFFDNEFHLGEDISFTDFVRTWTDQSGYPIVNVTKNNNVYILTQSRFSIWPSNDTSTKWYIATTYTNDLVKNFEDLTPAKWIKSSSTVTYIHDASQSTWHIFNLQSCGYYRVNYDTENWKQLIRQLNISHQVIHVLNRAQLIDDSLNLARAGFLEYSTALDLSTYLHNEEDAIPWYTAIDGLSYIVERMRRSNEGFYFIKSYVQDLAELIYKKTETLVFNVIDDHTTITSWNKFSVWACYLGSEYCMRNAMDNFEKWSIGQKISPDIKDAALCTGIKLRNDTETWKYVFNVYVTTKSASEKDSAQSALACAQDTLILYKYLEFLFDYDKGGPVRLQDFKDICASMSLTPQGIESLTNFLINNIEKILKTIPTGESIVTYMYRVLASKVALDSEIIKLYKLKNADGLPSSVRASFEESYLQVEQNLRWYNLYHASINQWTGAPADSTTPEPTTQSSTTPEPTTQSSTTETTTQSTTTETTSNMTTLSTETTSNMTTLSTETTSNMTTLSTETTSIMTTLSTETTSNMTTLSTETTSNMTTLPTETTSNMTTLPTETTSNMTTLADNETSTLYTTIPQFDFDNKTIESIISRCRNNANKLSDQNSSYLNLVISTIFSISLLWNVIL